MSFDHKQGYDRRLFKEASVRLKSKTRKSLLKYRGGVSDALGSNSQIVQYSL